MTSPPGPPSYPPSVPPPYGGGPARSSSSATVVTALLAALFVVATLVTALVVHDHDDSASAAPALGASSGSLQTDDGIPAGSGASYTATPSTVPAPTLSTSSYVPPPAPSPTRQPLDPEAINRTFQVYMNALLYRSLSQLRSATCPRLRKTETGTALDGKYINRWQSRAYTIPYYSDYVTITAKVRYVNPNTGGNDGSHTYRWYVERYPDGHYWVCGILK